MKIDKKNIGSAAFITLLFTYMYVVHNNDSVIYGFPFGHTTIYPQGSTFMSSFNINIVLLLLNFIIIYFAISLIKITWNKLITSKSKEQS